MKKLGRSLVGAIILTAVMGAVRAQAPDVLLQNTAKMLVTVSLDRTTYFPREAAVMTLTVTNPTAGPLPVLAPFNALTGCFYTSALTKLSRGGPTPWGGAERCSNLQVGQDAPTVTLGAGEQRRISLNSNGTFWEDGPPVMPTGDGNVPEDAGYYSIHYQYAESQSAAFRVVVPHLDAAAVVRVADNAYYDPATDTTVPTQEYMHAFALRWMNQSWICATLRSGFRANAVTANQNGDFDVGDAPGGYIRVAASDAPIASMSLTADSDDNLSVQWKDKAGAEHALALGKAPAPQPPAPVQVGLDPAWVGMGPGDTMEFAATVVGSPNSNVDWSLALGEDAPVGAQTGTIDGSGVYTSPSRTSAPYTVVLSARSQADSARSAIAVISLSAGEAPPETLSAPAAPAGPATGTRGTAYQFSVSGATSTLGHPVQYSVDWGDGTNSGWLAAAVTTASHAWTAAGAYSVTAQARCANDNTVVSAVSPALAVVISAPPVAAPTFSPSPGSYTSPQTVSLSTTTAGASVRYTTDGTPPSATAGTLYSSPIPVNTTTTINAIAYASGMSDSPVTSARYTIVQGPNLTITKTHTGNFTQGQTGAYTIIVSNVAAGPTSGVVTVTDTLSAGLSRTALAGAGWDCAALTCTRSDALAAGLSYPPLTLTVSVATNAPASVTNTATVSGGGDTTPDNNTATNPTVIGPPPPTPIHPVE